VRCRDGGGESPDRTRAGLAICGTRVTMPPSQVLRMLGRVPTDWSCPSRRPGPPSSIWSSLSSLLGSVPARGQDGLVQARDWWDRQGRALQSSTSGGPRGVVRGSTPRRGGGQAGRKRLLTGFGATAAAAGQKGQEARPHADGGASR
jgi:hypothetical protein